MATEVSSDEEFHSAPEGEEGEEEKGSERVKLKNQEDERLRSQLESMNLKSSKTHETADNDAASQSVNTNPDDGSVTDSQVSDSDTKVTGLDNRYVSEDHAPDKGGAVELTEEQIKVYALMYSLEFKFMSGVYTSLVPSPLYAKSMKGGLA